MTKPNIVVIITDGHRRDTVGAFGSQVCKTPNMDRLAAGGMCFDWAFTPTGLCSPARASFLSGTYAHEHGVMTNVVLHPLRRNLSPSADRLTPALREAGYRLGHVGKWHVNQQMTALDFGFDDYHSIDDYFAWRYDQRYPVPDAMDDYRTQVAAVDPVQPEQSRPAWLTGRAIELIDKYGDSEQPFYVRLDFQGPHFPNVVPEPYFSMYDPAKIDPWPNFDDSLAGKPAVQNILKRHWHTEEMSWQDWQPLVAAYYGEIALIDAQVGRVLDHLDAKGLTSNTLVIFAADHGDTMGAHGMTCHDYTMYDEIYRVPLIMRWPGTIPAGTRSDHFVQHFLDIHATIKDLIGSEASTGMHGRSLMPVFAGTAGDDWPEEAYCEFYGSHWGLYSMHLVRNRRYSYVYHPNDIDEFYDHQNDPYQLHNLTSTDDSSDSSVAMADMKRRLAAWMAATDDPLYNLWTVLWLTGDNHLAEQAPSRKSLSW